MRLMSARAGMAVTLFLVMAVSWVGCGGDVQDEAGLVISVCGPDVDDFPGLDDPFEYCYFMKICYKKPGETTLRGCQIVEYDQSGGFPIPGVPIGQAVFDSLPINEKISIVAECWDRNPTVVKPEPGNLLSRGQSVPVKRRKNDPILPLTIYMLKPSTFGPTLHFGGDVPCAYNQSMPFTERWGAAAIELYDGSVLLAGGVEDFDSACTDWADPACVEKASSTAELYMPYNGEFTLVGSDGTSTMSEKRAFSAIVELPDGRLAIFGGITSGGAPTASVDLYDPVAYTFTPDQPMANPRAYHTATVINDYGHVLLVGGFGGETTWEVWLAGMGSQASGQLGESRWHHPATLITKDIDPTTNRPEGMVVIAGGEGGGAPGAATPRATVEIFDIKAAAFEPMLRSLCANEGSGVQAARKTMHAAAFVPKRHFLYIAGGFEDGKHLVPVKDICVWNSSSETWNGEKGTFMLKSERGALTATALPGNVVLFAGGLTKTGVAQTVEIVFEYVNADGATVVDIGPAEYPIPMYFPRWGHGAQPTSDGKVLFFGGLTGNPDSPSMVQQTEVFNPQ